MGDHGNRSGMHLIECRRKWCSGRSLFKYYVDDGFLPLFTLGNPDSWFFLEFDRFTVFLSSGTLVFIAGVALTGLVGRAMGKRNALILFTLLNSVTVIGFFFHPSARLLDDVRGQPIG